MKGKRRSCRFRSLLCALTLILLAGLTKPTSAQNIEEVCDKDIEGEVESISAILASTSQTEIDTYSDTWEDYFGVIYYGTYEEAYLYDNNSPIDQTWAVDDGSGESYAYMSVNPINLGDTYLLVTDHYLWDEGSCEDPYDDWDECDVIPVTTTGVSVVAGAPYITTIDPTSAAAGNSSVSINVNGDNLVDPFNCDITPAITGSGINFTSSASVDPGYSIIGGCTAGSVTLNYSISSSASTGNQTLTLANRFGTSNGVNFYVYDPAPVISQINPNVWPANQVSTGTINGKYFGTNPLVSISDSSITFSYTPVNDGQINFSATVPSNNPGEIVPVTVTSQGYNGSGFEPAVPGESPSAQLNAQTQPAPVAGTFSVEYSSYIPVDHVTGPSSCSFQSYSPYLIYMGDANRGTFRTRQYMQIVPNGQTSSGYQPGVGRTRNYGYASPAIGSTLSAADEDGVPNDCYVWNNDGVSSNPSFTETVSFPQAYQGQVNYSGSASNPFEVQWVAISWNVSTLIDNTNPQAPTASIPSYSFTCYPSHQIKVNGQVVYLYTPPYNTAAYIGGCLSGLFSPVTGQQGAVSVPAQ